MDKISKEQKERNRKNMVGYNGFKIFDDLAKLLDTGISQDTCVSVASLQMLHLHAKVIACHCETLGMNSENCIAAINGIIPPYPYKEYKEVMIKWGLIDEDGNPII